MPTDPTTLLCVNISALDISTGDTGLSTVASGTAFINLYWNVGTTWNFTNSDLSPSLRVLRVPDLSSENALSVGAKMVKPELESLSAENKWFSSWVDLKRRIKIVKWPAFSRILVTLVMPFGAAA
ncbi:hypothetical protein OIU77_004952 [Salix suchowensis]|uniref:Uncharacterized protein n=1 Tax=Salix suchowensis TaxID=1278906 RepID=A0ABQ9AW22_9ROSI|nr:hypothetical protein OIU77_004952 [Salix suchowensis]